MRIHLSFHAKNLKNKAGLLGGTSDPYAIVTISGGPMDGTVLGQTETIENNLNPRWTKIFKFDYEEEESLLSLIVEIYDDMSGKKDDRLMGVTEFNIEPKVALISEDVDNGGELFLHVSECEKGEDEGMLELQLRGFKIQNVEPGVLGLGKSDPFYEVWKKHNGSLVGGSVHWDVVMRSDKLMDTHNPYWEPTPPINLEDLCNCDLDWPLKIVVYDWQKRGKHRIIGSVRTTARTLMDHVSLQGNADMDRALQLVRDDEDVGGSVSAGLVIVLKADVYQSS